MAGTENSADAYRVLVGKSEVKRPLARPRRRKKDNIKMYLQEVVWAAWTRSGSGQREVAGNSECCTEPSGSIECEEYLEDVFVSQGLCSMCV
jgi:hypothetical protein